MDNKKNIFLLGLAIITISYSHISGMQNIDEYDEVEFLTDIEERSKSKIGNWLHSTWQSVKNQLEERNPRKEELISVKKNLAKLEARKAANPRELPPALNRRIEVLKERKRLLEKQIAKDEQALDNSELLDKWFKNEEHLEDQSSLVEKWKGF